MLVYNFTSSQVNELSDYPLVSGKFTSHITPLSPLERGWGVRPRGAGDKADSVQGCAAGEAFTAQGRIRYRPTDCIATHAKRPRPSP